jgi:GAF domain-containing protein
MYAVSIPSVLIRSSFPHYRQSERRRIKGSALGCSRVSIVAVEPETDALRPVVVVGLSAEQEHQWRADQQQYGCLSDSPYTELVSRLRANDVLLLDMRQPPFLDQPNLYGVSTMLIAPMFVGDQLVGILSLDYGGVEHEYTEEEAALAGAIAKLAALVIERELLLYERAKAQVKRFACPPRVRERVNLVSTERVRARLCLKIQNL